MPTTIAAGRVGANVTIQGGGRLRRFLARSRTLTSRVLARIVADVLRRELLPALKSRVARRSGRMAQSLNIRHRGETVELRGNFYAPLVRWNNGRDSVVEAAMTLMEDNRNAINRGIESGIRRHLES